MAGVMSSGSRKAPDFRRTQYAFAAHIRAPKEAPAPADVEDRRMRIYRDLFYNNIRNLLAGNFPVVKRVLGDSAWQSLVRDYYAHHRARTPLFPEIAREFLQFLQEERAPDAHDPPFLLELAHYEWVELALNIAEADIASVAVDTQGDLLRGRPVLSPVAWVLSYRYPVHRIRPGYLPREAPEEPTHLVVYRDREDDVRFAELNEVSARLLNLIRENSGVTGAEHLRRIAKELERQDIQVVLDAGGAILADMRARDVILGTTP